MSMAEASSSSNELLADDAERVPAALRTQSLDFSHCTHFQRILSGLDQSSPRHRVGPYRGMTFATVQGAWRPQKWANKALSNSTTVKHLVMSTLHSSSIRAGVIRVWAGRS